MKIRLEQLNPTIGDIAGNVSLIKEAMTNANDDGIDLLVLPELVVCGYPPMDLIERPAFLEAIYEANGTVSAHAQQTAVLFGTATPNNNGSGRKCFNSALLVQQGKVLAEVHKTLLPTYDVYDELRYFEPAQDSFACVEFQGRKLGITVCEDIWHNFELSYLTYDVNPTEELVAQGAEAIFNVSASPYSKNKPQGRQQMLQQHARKRGVPIFYANQVGGNTELVSDGDSMAISSDAEVIGRAPLFEKAYIDLGWTGDGQLVNAGAPPPKVPSQIEQMFRALVLGLQDYLRKTGVADKVVLGLSGGIDSALVATIATEALDAENIVGITMPSEFSSEGSITDSQKLADNLGIALHEVAIRDIYDQFDGTLEPLFEGTSFGVAEENLQPRIRGTLLMAYSNKFGHMLLNTGNKSELATGYCTLYGDMAGGLGVIADLYKTEVYEMARWLNNEYFKEKVIPTDILSKPPSAELRPGQKDADSLPDYEVLDPILKAYIEEQLTDEDIIARGFEASTVHRITSLVDHNEYKRYQAVPGLKVSSKAFGTGRRWPIAQKWTTNRE